MLQKAESFVILRDYEYSSYFDKDYEEVEIFKDSVSDVFDSPYYNVESFVESPIGLAELYSSSTDEKSYLVIDVKVVKSNGKG